MVKEICSNYKKYDFVFTWIDSVGLSGRKINELIKFEEGYKMRLLEMLYQLALGTSIL